MNNLFRLITLVLILFTFACSSKSSTVTTTEEFSYTENDPNQVEIIPNTVEKTTVTEVKEENNSGDSVGILGATVGFIGDVIAFPFRLVGGIVDFIF